MGAFDDNFLFHHNKTLKIYKKDNFLINQDKPLYLVYVESGKHIQNDHCHRLRTVDESELINAEQGFDGDISAELLLLLLLLLHKIQYFSIQIVATVILLYLPDVVRRITVYNLQKYLRCPQPISSCIC